MKKVGLMVFAQRFWLALVLVGLSGFAQAQAADPYDIVADVTDQLVSAARQYNDDGDKATFDKKVLAALEPVVAFDYIAHVVMGNYHDDASDAQRQAFAETFKTSLVETYAKGIATYADSDIELQPGEVGDKSRVTVEQQVRYQGATHKLAYSMGKNRDGEWKLINLVLNGANLGNSMISQFKQMAGKYDGDIDKVIANWDGASDS
ncbi:MlaC/ttg2D family ABC transporter substrate-binding protein [Gilvimarinus xylanilyticus]|uniref:ABC transporter substrate-binding protein n=1 Tax=Gilvimarinus xylanilyticus TaxID=2944139 RepID=A0A9X2I7C4_9GAMM|nr:ABC transporter substrate-binding protein [Gilvimarinus xylanilyticus]MCP8900182.1 ABC transporter substrate-binding protein [Gilvimarinus xylanilyticus]